VACLPVLVFFFLGACGETQIQPPKGKAADELYDEGLSQLNQQNYRQAIETFYQLKYNYPSDTATMLADLKIADAYYANEEYVEAIESYDDFRKMHPASPYIPYAVYMLGRCYYHMVLSVDRDQTNTELALNEFLYLLTHFPKTPYAWDGYKKAQECMIRLSEHEIYVGNFYYGMKKYDAAIQRFETALSKYPSIPLDEKALFRLADCYRRNQKLDMAQRTWAAIMQQYPDSKYAKKARRLIDEEQAAPPSEAIPPGTQAASPSQEPTVAPESQVKETALPVEPPQVEDERPLEETSSDEMQTTGETGSEGLFAPDSGGEGSEGFGIELQVLDTALEVTGGQLINPSPSSPGDHESAISDVFPDDPPERGADTEIQGGPRAQPSLSRDSPHRDKSAPSESRPSRINESADLSPFESPSPIPPVDSRKVPDEVARFEDETAPAQSSDTQETVEKVSSAPSDGGESSLGFAELKEDRPINITADRMDSFQRENRVIFEGNVVVRQDDTYIYAQRITAELAPEKEGGGIRQVVAAGEVRITKKDRVAICERAEFDHISRTISLWGNPKIWQGSDWIDGEQVVVNLNEEKMTILGSEEKRVSAVLHPKDEKGASKVPEAAGKPRPSLTAPLAPPSPRQAPSDDESTQISETALHVNNPTFPIPVEPSHEGEEDVAHEVNPSSSTLSEEDVAAHIAAAALEQEESGPSSPEQDRQAASKEELFIAQASGPAESVEAFVERWRTAWVSKDLEAYLDCYSSGFKAEKVDFSAWRDRKAALNREYRFIQVTVEDLEVRPFENGVRVTFIQRFKADDYHDVGRKDLDLVNEDDRWKILRESWEPLPLDTSERESYRALPRDTSFM
jgi:outer membrane protein assembly factor BamD